MKRLIPALGAFLILATVSLAGPARAETETELLQRVEDYLNGITTLDARFTQLNYDGSTADGEFQLTRPLMARIAYDDPPTIMVARGQKYQFWDAEIGQFYEGPVSASPASILLQSNIDLDQAINVRGLRRDGDLVYLTVEPSEEPGAGVLTMVFNDPIGEEDQPLELAQWFVRDAQGYITRVNLNSVEFGVPLANSLFDIDHQSLIRPSTTSD
jgi:outer membrane lipoprotein-sorting protein